MFYLLTDFQKLSDTFLDFWNAKGMARTHFACCVSEEGDMQKGSFQRMAHV